LSASQSEASKIISSFQANLILVQKNYSRVIKSLEELSTQFRQDDSRSKIAPVMQAAVEESKKIMERVKSAIIGNSKN